MHWLGVVIAVLGAWILFKTQLDGLDGIARSVSDMLWTGSRRARAWRGGDICAIYYSVLILIVLWGFVAIGFASFASLVDNLIEAVNILGSIFYGTVLGLFVVAFFLKRVTSTPVLIAALIAQTVVATLYFASDLGFLWFNVVGCAIVVVLSLVFEVMRGGGSGATARARA